MQCGRRCRYGHRPHVSTYGCGRCIVGAQDSCNCEEHLTQDHSAPSHWRLFVRSFVTPLETCLCEKSFNRNAEQVCSPYLISLLLGGCRGVHTYIFDIVAHGCSTVRTYGLSMDMGVRIYRYGRSIFCYGRINLHVLAYGHSTFTFSSNVLYVHV